MDRLSSVQPEHFLPHNKDCIIYESLIQSSVNTLCPYSLVGTLELTMPMGSDKDSMADH